MLKPASRPPRGLATAGRRLWRSVADDYELDQHEYVLLTQACRVLDLCDRLDAEVAGAPVTVTNHRGDQVAHPAIVESRQQSITLTRLLASLRLPSGEQSENRPQRRGAARGSYGIRGAV